MRGYESHINSEVMSACIQAYEKGDKTQKYYCEKFNVNYHAFMRYYKEYKLTRNNKKETKNTKKMTGGDLEFSETKSELTGKTTNLFSETSTIKSVSKDAKKSNLKNKEVYHIPMPASYVSPN